MSKHTPGPWKASGFADMGLVHPGARVRIIWSPGESMDVAYAAPTASPADEALLAAAPELLEALEAFLGLDGHADTACNSIACVCGQEEKYEEVSRRARAAIRKAKGEA